MIHGRFQPFHNGHLAYLLAAAARCPRLLVGITNPDRARTNAESEDRNRHLPENNPFTYIERLLMIEAAVAEADVGIPVKIIPFPINYPELWSDYVPSGTVHFLRLFSAWGALKRDRLRAAGYEVVTLDDGASKDVSGQDVRAALRAGGDFERLVPRSVAQVIQGLRLDRASNLHSAV